MVLELVEVLIKHTVVPMVLFVLVILGVQEVHLVVEVVVVITTGLVQEVAGAVIISYVMQIFGPVNLVAKTIDGVNTIPLLF